jgi:hypothetical protein
MRNFQWIVCQGAVLAWAMLALGCSHTVKYKLAESDRWRGTARPEILRVDAFVENGAVPLDEEVLIGQKRCRTNARKRYKPEPAAAVTDMVATHLAHSGLFRKVIRGTSEPADLILSGTISNYTATAIINDAAESISVSSSTMGLAGAIIGSLATAGMKTDIAGKVELSPITLRDNSGNLLWQGSAVASTNFTAHFKQGGRGAIYKYPDDLLKRAVNDLVQKLSQASSSKP